MLPKKKLRAIPTTDFRPSASNRVFYKVFAYPVVGCVEEIVKAKQPEQQHCLRPPDRRLEEHLLTANLLLDKTAAAEITVCIVRLDLSKAFDRIHWPTLWIALQEQGVPEQVLLLLVHAYDEQLGEVRQNGGRAGVFP